MHLKAYDVTIITSSVTWLFDSPWALSYRFPIGNNPLFPLVSEIFSLKDADIQTSTSIDNKECLYKSLQHSYWKIFNLVYQLSRINHLILSSSLKSFPEAKDRCKSSWQIAGGQLIADQSEKDCRLDKITGMTLQLTRTMTSVACNHLLTDHPRRRRCHAELDARHKQAWSYCHHHTHH